MKCRFCNETGPLTGIRNHLQDCWENCENIEKWHQLEKEGNFPVKKFEIRNPSENFYQYKNIENNVQNLLNASKWFHFKG